MTFGLTNAPGTFQLSIDIIFRSVRWKISIVYLDDIIVFLRTIHEHMAHLKTVLTLLKDGGLALKLHKCFLPETGLEYLGYIVCPSCFHAASKTCNIVQAMKYQPTSLNSCPSSVYVRGTSDWFRISPR